MNVYISWFGEPSHKVAQVLKEWLPLLLQSVHPYVPVGRLEERAPLGSGPERPIDETSFGILCLTHENLDALWLTFEAGAVVRTLGRSRVYAFLFGGDRTQVRGPLSQLPLVTTTRDEIRRLATAINEACGAESLGKTQIDRLFDLLWPDLETQLKALSFEQAVTADEPARPSEGDTLPLEILQEILNSVRGLQIGGGTSTPVTTARPAETVHQFADTWNGGNQDFLSAIDMELTQVIERLELAKQHGEPPSAQNVLDEILPTLSRLRGWIRNRSKRLAHGYQRSAGAAEESPPRRSGSGPGEERRVAADGEQGPATPKSTVRSSGSGFSFSPDRLGGGRLKLVRGDEAGDAPDRRE